jgi:hypothetical protein
MKKPHCASNRALRIVWDFLRGNLPCRCKSDRRLGFLTSGFRQLKPLPPFLIFAHCEQPTVRCQLYAITIDRCGIVG